MKNITILILGFITVLTITSASPNKQEAKKAFEKIVFLELTVDQDSMLFKPYSKAWKELWQFDSDVFVSGSHAMNYEKYKSSFKDRKDNLWTILHPLVIDGDVQLYYPYDPRSYGMGAWDDGELHYPVMDKERTETFLTSEEVRSELSYALGVYGPLPDVPLVDEYGENVVVTFPDGTQSYKYADPDYIWYKDKDIVKYKLRVRIEVNKKGKEKKRVIEAFCPMVNQTNEVGEVVGDRDLLWFDAKELKPILKEAYYLDKDWKPVSYWDYFQQKVENADFRTKN